MNSKKWFYRGSTNNLKRRLLQHNRGKVNSTKAYVPLKLVYFEFYLSENGARRRESRIKKSGSVWMPLRNRILESLETQ